MSSDLSLKKHVSAVSAACFCHLRQIRRVRQSLDAGSAATLIHAFVTSRVDYCNAVLAGSPRFTTVKLQRVMNSAAVRQRLVAATARRAPLARRHRPSTSTIQARRADVLVSSWNGSAVATGKKRMCGSADVRI